MRSARRSLTVLALAAAVFAGLAALSRLRAALPPPASLAVRSARITLPPGDPAHGRLGALVFLGGLVLESDDPRFGGLSDLRTSADGRRLLALSDCGYGFSAELDSDASGAPVALVSPRLVDLRGPGGRALLVGENDAESLVADGTSLEVGFEGRGRVWRYAGEPPFSAPIEAVAFPPGLARCGSNSGLETMTDLGGGRRFLVCEGERTPSLTTRAWVGGSGDWVERAYPLLFDGGWAGEPFRPTGATSLSGGDLLVAERRFPPFGIRVVRLSRGSLEGARPLEPVEIARLDASSLVDNYEGIDVRQDGAGRVLVYLLSDDNGCAKPGGTRLATARTRLVVFELVG